MDKVDITIIGAGIVGLAIADELSSAFPDREILVLEKWDSFGREISSRNSEVIHAGIYYGKDTLKAKLCLEGKVLLYDICRKHGLSHQKTGKIIIATCAYEEEDVRKLFESGRANGVEELEEISSEKIHEMEPQITGTYGVFSGTTGIIDTHQLMKFYETQAISRGVTFSYSSEVNCVAFTGNDYRIEIKDADNEAFCFLSAMVINSAGLHSAAISRDMGVSLERDGFRLDYYKGEYFSVANRHRNRVSRLIYPVPTSYSLGLHTVIKLDGTLKLGPNAFPVNEIDYNVSEAHRDEFFNEAKKYLPFLEKDDLEPDMSGIRPKLFYHDQPYQDFYIAHESARGFPGFINLVGIESPGFTAAPAIADYVKDMIKKEC